MPGGDSVSSSGWDGIVQADKGNIWVPDGASFWKWAVPPTSLLKHVQIFGKEINKSHHRKRLKVALFSYRHVGGQKDSWLKEVRAENIWLDVYALDADDLETWLENTPAVALWFSELTGRTGAGIESISHFWERWRTQSQFPLTKETLLAGREEEKIR
jgi:hypothetical protein